MITPFMVSPTPMKMAVVWFKDVTQYLEEDISISSGRSGPSNHICLCNEILQVFELSKRKETYETP